MKKLIIPIILCILFFIELVFIDEITDYTSNLISGNPKVITSEKNEYTKNYNFMFVENVDDFVPYSYNDLVNIIYTVINNGWEDFTFYCPNEYTNCIQDVTDITSQDLLLTEINNYTSPFNSFATFSTSYDETGEVSISLEKVYSNNDIIDINKKLDDILNNVITDDMSLEDKIKTIHDYIINNTKYDVLRNETGESEYRSNTAYGALIEGYATCNGYADAMALILDRFEIKNYRIASSKHIWNALNYNNNWVHLDLTWDDPVSDDGTNYLYYDYFLIDNTKLDEVDEGLNDHIFDKQVYLEFNDGL